MIHAEGLAASEDALVNRVRRSLVTIQGRHHGFGAGIIWRREGLVLANNHVISKHRPVVEIGGTRYPARVIANDKDIDLAVLQIEAVGLSPAMWHILS